MSAMRARAFEIGPSIGRIAFSWIRKNRAALALDDPGREMLPFARQKIDHLGRDEVVVHVDDIHRVLLSIADWSYRMKLILPCGRSASLSRIALRSRIFRSLPYADQLVVVVAYIGIDRLVAHPMHRKIRRHQNILAVGAETRTLVIIRRVRECGFSDHADFAEQLLYARSNSHRVVRDDEQGISRVAFGNVSRWDLVHRIFGEQLQPLVQPPFVEQRRLLV